MLHADAATAVVRERPGADGDREQGPRQPPGHAAYVEHVGLPGLIAGGVEQGEAWEVYELHVGLLVLISGLVSGLNVRDSVVSRRLNILL